MANLDEFTECTVIADSECSVCETEHIGTLEFVDSQSENDNEENTNDFQSINLCKTCLFTETSGRFKNQDIQTVIREYEEIRYIETDEEDNVLIHTTSELGDLTHIHYTTETTQVAQKAQAQAALITAMKLTGVSEIFDSDEGFLAQPSPYTDIAHDVVSQHNEQQIQNI